jgi:hypothetical protein
LLIQVHPVARPIPLDGFLNKAKGEIMKSRLLRLSAIAAALLTWAGGPPSFADDGGNGEPGKPILKSMSKLPTPTVAGHVDEAEHAYIHQMKFYVPSQAASGTASETDPEDKAEGDLYFDIDALLRDTRILAKPLIGVYQFGPVESPQMLNAETGELEDAPIGFIGHGKRDVYGAVSLDDGVTWKKTNLSESAFETSCDNANCNVIREDVPLFADTAYAYPGDVTNVYHSVMDNKALVVWQSRYCASGQPSYSLDNPEKPELVARRAAIAAYLKIDLAAPSSDDLYLLDMYGVAGSQRSVDYSDPKVEDYAPNQTVGAVPFSCLWSARGVLNQGDDPRTQDVVELSYMRWFKAERLTSGARDVNRVVTVCVSGAGCGITWQEDPEGLRGGEGGGPGEGWSGAVAHSQTDVWYAYIDYENFDVVQNPADETGATPMTLAAYELAALDKDNVTQKPKPFVPFAMPMRVTDNAKCNVDKPKPYCYGSAIAALGVAVPTDGTGIALDPRNYGLKDLCADTVTVLTGNPDSTLGEKETLMCVTQDGLPLVGNTAATRPSLALYGYDTTSPKKLGDSVIDSAFVAILAEEDKGLGAFTFDADGNACEQENNSDPDCFTFDEGKNIRYYTFSMSIGDTVGGFNQDRLLANLTQPGHQLNQPEVDWTTGEFYPPTDTALLWDFDDYNFEIYKSEYARRGSWLGQDIYKVHRDTSNARNGLLALPTWKQGIMNQGGPADVLSRQIVIPKNWKLDNRRFGGNPYAFRNMACEEWAYNPAENQDANPYYPGGLCLESAINVSATIPDQCQDSETGGEALCPQVDFSQGTAYAVGDTNPTLQGSQVTPNKTKVLSWHQCPASFTTVKSTDGTVLFTCDNDLRTDTSSKAGSVGTLRDQSWYNPLDVAKGHRGFLDGDFVMMLYAWSPNWRQNADGHDRYELYIRRSFTGGNTWTTLPGNYAYWDPKATTKTYRGDGTVTCETFRSDQTQASGDLVEPRVCNSYGAGVAEQARNVTQLQAMRITTLDPRYAITGSPQGVSNTLNTFGYGVNPYGEDVRNPSRYFVVFETGDNTTTAVGEPEPLDLHYSRAINFGDDYVVWADEVLDPTLAKCYPSDPHEDTDPETGVPAEHIGSGFCNEFDKFDQGTPGLEASEASLTANPGGQFLYGVWAQIEHQVDENNTTDWDSVLSSDAMARRVWWLDNFISETYGWTFGQGTGDGTPASE